VFVHDRQTGTTERIDVSSGGVQADADYVTARINADGHLVCFVSSATNLVAGDTNARSDVFVRDRNLLTTTLISRTPGGAPGNGRTNVCAIAADSGHVAFNSNATDLVAGDSNGSDDIFVYDPSGPAEQPEFYLDSMYENVPKQHPGILGQTDNEGADVVKLAAGAALGLDIDYYMQVNLAGFRQIIDALGGITVNVNYRVPIGGDYGAGPGSNSEKKPSGYIEPGPEQKLDGYHALWFARGRYGLSDPSRQERQRCTIHALVSSANPQTLVTSYQQIAKAGKQLLRTDIPQDILAAFIQLALKVKNAKVTNIDLDKNKNFPTGKNPDYTAMQEIIQKAIAPKTNPVASTPSAKPTKKPTSSTTTKRPTTPPKPTATPGEAQNLNDACAYNPSQTGN